MNGRGWLGAGRGALAAAVLLAGCASLGPHPPTGDSGLVQTAPTATYEVVQGRDAALVDRLRAAPAVARPEIADGGTPAGDEAIVRAQGLVRIGIGRYPQTAPEDLRAQVLEQARKVGADKVLLYPPASAEASVLAVFFVRLQLPFGANFRDLTDAERQMLGSGGVEIGQIVGLTPASAANLREGDFVVAFDREPVRDRAHFQSLLREHMGQRVTLTIRRGKVSLRRLIVLGRLPDAPRP